MAIKDLYAEDLEKVASTLDELYSDWAKNSIQLSQVWLRNVAFANGNQQLGLAGNGVAQMSGQQFLVSQNQNTRPNMYVTNEIEPIIRTLVSYMTRAKPTATAVGFNNDDKSRNASRMAERVIEAKYVIDNEYENSRMSAFWAMTVGTVFRKDYWDTSAGKDFSEPQYDERGAEVIGEDGKVVMQNQKTGDSAVTILTPLTVSMDWSVQNFDEIPWIREDYLMDLEWVQKAYNQTLPGYTGKAMEVEAGANPSEPLMAREQMKYSTPVSLGLASTISVKDKVLVSEVYIRPTEEFPKGRMLVKANAEIVYDSWNGGDDLGCPYFMPAENITWHPYTMFIFEPYIGRLLGKSLVEQLTPLNMRVNEINGAILENANTMAKPDWLTPENSLKRGIINGRGGNVYTYRPIPGAAAPARQQGVPLPEQFFKEKQMIIDQMVRIAGTNFAMQGQPPAGVTAASAIQTLLENAASQQSDLMNSWAIFHERGSNNKLRLIRNFNKLPNETLINYLRTIKKDALDMEIRSFIGEDLGDGITLKIEPGSMIPKSQVQTAQVYNDLAKQGGLGPAFQEDSPRGEKLRIQLMEALGLEPFKSEQSIEIKKAEWENDRIINGLPVEVSPYDIAAIHIPCHTEKIQDPQFLERATDEQKLALDAHIQAHQQEEAMKAQQMQQQAMMGPPGGPQNGAPQGPPKLLGAPQAA